jgi:hypothetical protein
MGPSLSVSSFDTTIAGNLDIGGFVDALAAGRLVRGR